MIWKQLLLCWIRPSLPDHVSPSAAPRGGSGNILQLGGGAEERVLVAAAAEVVVVVAVGRNLVSVRALKPKEIL